MPIQGGEEGKNMCVKFLIQLLCGSLAATLLFCTSQVNAETLDETYQKALKEGGTLNLLWDFDSHHGGCGPADFRKALPGY